MYFISGMWTSLMCRRNTVLFPNWSWHSVQKLIFRFERLFVSFSFLLLTKCILGFIFPFFSKFPSVSCMRDTAWSVLVCTPTASWNAPAICCSVLYCYAAIFLLSWVAMCLLLLLLLSLWLWSLLSVYLSYQLNFLK